MSDLVLWKPVWEPNKFSSEDLTRDKAETPDMSELGVGHGQENSLEPG
jgi:hypothetical protein